MKLYSVFVIKNILDTVLIVDADVVFMRKISFETNGKICYNFGSEYHAPYFEHMKYLHPNFKRTLECSGICHHMMFEKKILKEIFDLVETYHKMKFWKSFMEMTIKDSPIAKGSGASEYEIYFHYIFSKYPNEYILRQLKWYNYGNLNHINQDRNRGFDYIAYHSYLRI